MQPSTYIEISKSAFKQNYDFIQSLLQPNVKFSSVIKGNAYGHGIEVIVPVLEEIGVSHFSVFNGDEAFRVKQVCRPETEIMVMGMLTDEQLEWCINKGIEFYIFNLHRLEQTIDIALKQNKVAKVHFEIETGMNRTGLSSEELMEALKLLENHQDCLELYGLCTHLAGAESIANYYRIKNQFIRYKKTVKQLKNMGIQPKYRHISCSAGTILYPDTQLDMVRVGIMQYGFFPTNEVMINYLAQHKEIDDPLKRGLTWKSQVMSIKEVDAGEFIGYGNAYLSGKKMKIATIPIGYGYGFARKLTNQGKVIIRGEFANVVGVVNMNIITVDITEIPEVEIGDIATIIGRDGNKDITVSSFSDISNQVNYELLTRLPNDIPRVVVE